MPTMITRKGLELACYFEPDRSVPSTHDAFLRINYEGFFFCNAEERDRFLADPVEYCGLLTDPVSKNRFRPTRESPMAEHEGVLYLFEGVETAGYFAEAPGDFVLPGYRMMDDEMESAEG